MHERTERLDRSAHDLVAATLSRATALPQRLALALGDRSHMARQLLEDGLPSYTTSAGWLGYDDEKLRRLCREAVDAGWTHVKLKVGADVENDVRRCRIAREIIGPTAS